MLSSQMRWRSSRGSREKGPNDAIEIVCQPRETEVAGDKNRCLVEWIFGKVHGM